MPGTALVGASGCAISADSGMGPPGPPAALCIRPVADRGPLTKRQREILAYVAPGLSNREIADTLIVGIATVRSHLYGASRQLGAHTRRAAALVATSYNQDENAALTASA